MSSSRSHAARGSRERSLRIIAGAWRGRRWRFPAGDIRPTPDRVRETLFNWIGPGGMNGLRCLDLFAGSGALGLEALSRGAAHVTFVDQDRAAIQELRQLLAAWGAAADAAEVQQADARAFLARPPPAGYDLVFLDPPFAAGLLGAMANRLEAGFLRGQARIYLECPAREALPSLPERWQFLRSGRAGEVGYHLYTV